MPNKFKQFDKSGEGGSRFNCDAGDKIKTIIMCILFGITLILAFIVIVISFTQIETQGKLPWSTEDFCSRNASNRPIRIILPNVPAGTFPTEPPTLAPTAPPPTAPPATSARSAGTSNVRDDPTEAPTGTPTPSPTKPPSPYTRWLNKKDIMECPWPGGESAFRIIVYIAAFINCILIFTLVMKKEVWQAFWFCLLCSLALVVLIFILFVVDANTLSKSRDYCQEQAVLFSNPNTNTYNPDGFEFKCDLSSHVAVAVLNVMWLLWLVDAIFLYLYVKSWKVVIYS